MPFTCMSAMCDVCGEYVLAPVCVRCMWCVCCTLQCEHSEPLEHGLCNFTKIFHPPSHLAEIVYRPRSRNPRGVNVSCMSMSGQGE